MNFFHFFFFSLFGFSICFRLSVSRPVSVSHFLWNQPQSTITQCYIQMSNTFTVFSNYPSIRQGCVQLSNRFFLLYTVSDFPVPSLGWAQVGSKPLECATYWVSSTLWWAIFLVVSTLYAPFLDSIQILRHHVLGGTNIEVLHFLGGVGHSKQVCRV